MDSIPSNPILEYNSDTLQYLRTLYGLEKPERMEEAINLMVEWIKKQEHLTKRDLSREYLERMIIFSKGSVERAKKKYDKLCTLRTLLPQFYDPVDMKNIENIFPCFLPKLTKDHCRVILVKLARHSYSDGVFDFYKYLAKVLEYQQAHDYSNGVILIYDCIDTNLLDLIKNLNLVETRNGISLITEGYGLRLKGIHFLSTSKAVDVIIGIIKQAVSAKIAQRISVHRNVDSLYEYVDKDILPVDYGGKEKSTIALSEDLFDALTSKEFTEYFEMMKQARTDEARRSQETFNDQYMGVAGSFRKLSVD